MCDVGIDLSNLFEDKINYKYMYFQNGRQIQDGHDHFVEMSFGFIRQMSVTINIPIVLELKRSVVCLSKPS